MNPIEDYIAAEKLRMSWLDKLLRNYPDVKSTRTIASPLPKIKEGDEKIFKPSLWLASGSIIIVLPIILVLLITTCMLIFRPFFPPLLIAPPFCCFLLFITSKYSPFNKNYFYRITLNAEGITAGENRFYWKEISEMAIHYKNEGKNSRSSLIIFKKDHTFKDLNLYFFWTSDSKIARYVEYYKNKTSAD